MVALILGLNSYVVSENKELSSDMKNWQNSGRNQEPRILTYLRGRQHYYSMSMKSVTTSFSTDFIKRLNKQDDFYVQGNSMYTRVGVAIGQVDGKL